MATPVTIDIHPTTGDYSSLGAYASQQFNLVNLDEVHTVHCYPMEDGSVAFSGWTLDDTRCITIMAAPTARHNGYWTTGAYRMTGGLFVLTVQDHINVDGLQIDMGNNVDIHYGIVAYTNAPFTISNCITAGSCLSPQLGATGIGMEVGRSGNVINCLSLHTQGAGEAVRGIRIGTGYIYNCTVINADTGFLAPTNRCVNCGYSGVGTGFNTTPQDHCSDVDPYFVGASDYHLHLFDTEWKGQGTDLSGIFTTDIDGHYRNMWDIGAFRGALACLGQQTRHQYIPALIGGQ